MKPSDTPKRSRKDERSGSPERPGRRNESFRREKNSRPVDPKPRFQGTRPPLRERMNADDSANFLSFPGILLAEAVLMNVKDGDIQPHSSEALAHFDYEFEKKLKQRALEAFWQKNRLPGKTDALVPSPKPRHYRTTSKRRGRWSRHGFILSMNNGDLTSVLDPESHNQLYAALRKLLNLPHYTDLAKAVNYCILRGNDDRLTLIVNIAQANGKVIRQLKAMAAELQKNHAELQACFMYLDETRSDYYLESQRPEQPVSYKKIFGSAFLDLKLNDRKFLYPPTVFSQVNASILPQFTGKALELLAPDKSTRFLDLYCGYGLFGLLAAEKAGAVFGMDLEGPAITAAIANATHLYPNHRMRYFAASVTPDSLESYLPPADPERREVVLLDPPRHGTANGVIESLLERHPDKVLHIFCSVDEIPKELKIWASNGYQPVRVIPFDMFAGSINLEVMILLERTR